MARTRSLFSRARKRISAKLLSGQRISGQLLLAAGVASLAAASACGPVDAVDRGRDLYADARLSISPSNVFSCASCHANTPAPMPMAMGDDPTVRHYPGYTLSGAAQRPSYWGGELTLLLDAVNFCYTQFMSGATLAADDAQGLALLAYLQSLAPSPDAARPLTIVKNIDTTYLGALPAGDAQRGGQRYASSCAPCHGDSHTGNGRVGPYVSIIPEDTVKSFGAMARAVTAEKVRHGKFFGIGGSMPPYSIEALGDDTLADILAYLLP